MKFIRNAVAGLALLAAVSAHAAVTSSFFRTSRSENTSATWVFAQATLSGTYTTGGFTWTPLTISAGPGSSPTVASSIMDVQWRSPLGYIYVTTWANNGFVLTATTKIFTAPNTELTNGAAVPDASVPVVIVANRR